MKISAILAINNDYEIGLNGDLPWNCREDLQHFKNLTLNHCVLMGSKTYYSIGKPLPNRTNIVVSCKNIEIDNCNICKSVEEGIDFAKKLKEEELFIIGGMSIYKYCYDNKLLDRIYLSHIVY